MTVISQACVKLEITVVNMPGIVYPASWMSRRLQLGRKLAARAPCAQDRMRVSTGDQDGTRQAVQPTQRMGRKGFHEKSHLG